MMAKPKMIFVPADCFDIKMSRSYYLGKYLSEYFDLVWIQWKDGRDIEWSLGGQTIWYKRWHIWIKNVTRKTIIKKEKAYTIFFIPFMSYAFIRYIFGNVFARRLARNFNKIMLNKVVKTIKPDIILYADNFLYFSVIKNTNALIFSDTQDDSDFESCTKKVKKFELGYFNHCYGAAAINYIVTESAGFNMGKYINSKFTFLPNGAEFNEIQKIDQDVLSQYRKKMKIENKVVISFIGGEVWFDAEFVKELVRKSLQLIPDHVFIFIGNQPIVHSENVINIGVIPPEESYIYYNLSDIGILPVNTKDNPLLYNSMPLKIVQYSCIGKPIICSDISWVSENHFSNVFISEFSTEVWIQKIKSIGTTKYTDSKWQNYDWQTQAGLIWNDFNKYKTNTKQ